MGPGSDRLTKAGKMEDDITADLDAALAEFQERFLAEIAETAASA